MEISNKSKLSIIIPTLQKNTIILTKLIDELVVDDSIGEIIIIDNSLKGFEYSSDKVKVIIPKENLFVNPAWNYGIELAKYDYCGILNDDILLPKNLCSTIFEFIQSNDVGIVGINNKSIFGEEENEKYDYPANSPITFSVFEDNFKKGLGYWAIAIFGKKENYHKIPDEMKIWYGDHYLFQKCVDSGKLNYQAYCREIKHVGSLTSSNPNLNAIKQNDADFYALIDKRFVGTDVTKQSKKTFLKFLFSIKNASNKRSKLVTILGFEFKIKIRI